MRPVVFYDMFTDNMNSQGSLRVVAKVDAVVEAHEEGVGISVGKIL